MSYRKILPEEKAKHTVGSFLKASKGDIDKAKLLFYLSALGGTRTSEETKLIEAEFMRREGYTERRLPDPAPPDGASSDSPMDREARTEMTTCGCGGQIREGLVNGKRQLACIECGRDADALLPAARPSQPKIPGIQPGRQSVKLTKSEAQIQQAIVDGLRANGYTVWETSEKRKPVMCPECEKWFTPTIGRSGITRGLPDLLVRNPKKWPPWFFIGLEVKSTDGAVRKEQHLAAVRGELVVVWNLAEALEAVVEADRAILGEAL